MGTTTIARRPSRIDHDDGGATQQGDNNGTGSEICVDQGVEERYGGGIPGSRRAQHQQAMESSVRRRRRRQHTAVVEQGRQQHDAVNIHESARVRRRKELPFRRCHHAHGLRSSIQACYSIRYS